MRLQAKSEKVSSFDVSAVMWFEMNATPKNYHSVLREVLKEYGEKKDITFRGMSRLLARFTERERLARRDGQPVGPTRAGLTLIMKSAQNLKKAAKKAKRSR